MDCFFEHSLHSRRRSNINHETEANHASYAVQLLVLVCCLIAKCTQDEVKREFTKLCENQKCTVYHASFFFFLAPITS